MIDVDLITSWLREGDYLSMAIGDCGHLVIIETQTGKEVSTVDSLLASSLLPLAKKKISNGLSKKYPDVTFKEVYSNGIYNCLILGGNNLMASAKGDDVDLVMLRAVATYIQLERNKNGTT